MILLSAALLLLAMFGAPLFTVIAASAMIGYRGEDIDLMAIAIEIAGIAGMPLLSAIPLFTFAGYLLSESKAPGRLVRLSGALLGWMPGGLALVALGACGGDTASDPDARVDPAVKATSPVGVPGSDKPLVPLPPNSPQVLAQATAVLITHGETTVMCTCMRADPRPGLFRHGLDRDRPGHRA